MTEILNRLKVHRIERERGGGGGGILRYKLKKIVYSYWSQVKKNFYLQ